ncbi:MAG: TIGR03621 family F420-dependent LLM class oxidoreductase [Actinomycetota bacterium]
MSVQGGPRDHESWLALAKDVEASGFDGLYVADHPGVSSAPFVALAAAAAVTERIQLGTCVVNAGMWSPMALAIEVATLDLLSGGRAVLGVGAGHTPSEWTAVGRAYPSAGERVDHMIELTTTTMALLSGETVSHSGEHFTLEAAMLTHPRPVRSPVPLAVGGNGRRVLRFGGEHADIVGITGLGRTLADGHSHAVDWSPSAIRRTVDTVQSSATAAGRSPQIEALVQHIEISNDAERAAAQLVDAVPGATVDDLLAAPFIWMGTADEIRARLRSHQRDLGITRYMVRSHALADVRLVFDATITG